MLRNLIRRNDEALLEDITFLLEIPSIKSMVHLAINSGQENELLRLARRVNNEAARQELLKIPAVFDLAQRHDFYFAKLLEKCAAQNSKNRYVLSTAGANPNAMFSASPHSPDSSFNAPKAGSALSYKRVS